jgi:hypothetical protein
LRNGDFSTYATRRSFHSLNCAMGWTIEFEDGDLDGGRARPSADIRRRPLPLSCATETLSLLCYMAILGYGVCSQIKSQPCVNGTWFRENRVMSGSGTFIEVAKDDDHEHGKDIRDWASSWCRSLLLTAGEFGVVCLGCSETLQTTTLAWTRHGPKTINCVS